MKIKGNKKDNTLVGEDGNDKILGLNGDDTITAKGGHDIVDGGGGNDAIKIAGNTSADVDAGKGDDVVTISAGALSSDIDLGKGNDSVQIESSSKLNQSFTIVGGDGSDSVNFALVQGSYTVSENGDEAYTVVDANGNSYALSSISNLTFNGIPYTPAVEPNQQPVVSSQIADQTAVASSAYSFQVSATAFTDPDGDALTYSATLADGSDLPTWLTFDAASRTFSGTPGTTNVGTIAVRVTASDGSLTNFDDFNITVNSAPVVTPPTPTIIDPTVAGRVLQLTNAYDYDVSESGGVISVSYAGRTTTFNSAAIDSIKTLGSHSVDIDTTHWNPRPIDGDVNFTNVTFQEAGPGTPDQKFDSSFEIAPDVDINITGNITVNGNAADYFRAAWDWLDDRYTQSLANYYAEELNSYGIDLGIQYALYLENGGAPLFDIAKYTSDPVGGNGIVDRMQTLHDNLLGNLDERSIADKFDDKVLRGDPAASEVYSVDDILDRIEAALGTEYTGVRGNYDDGRGIFTGNEGDYNKAAHNNVRRFDYEHGIDRPDNVDYTIDGSVDKKAWNVSEMWYGSGNRTDNWVVERNVGANVETALKVHYRQGNEIDPAGVDSNGVVLFNVDAGSQTAGENGAGNNAANRAAWSFDYSIVTGINGKALNVNALDFELKVDTDKTDQVDYMIFKLQGGNGITPFVAEDENGNFLGSSGEDPSSGDGTLAYIAQDSINFGFDFIKDAIEAGGYAFGDGEFDIELSAYKNNTHDLLSSVHIRVIVDDGIVI